MPDFIVSCRNPFKRRNQESEFRFFRMNQPYPKLGDLGGGSPRAWAYFRGGSPRAWAYFSDIDSRMSSNAHSSGGGLPASGFGELSIGAVAIENVAPVFERGSICAVNSPHS